VAILSVRVAPLAKGGIVIVLSLALGTVGNVAAGSTTSLSGLGKRDILGAGGGFDTRLTESSGDGCETGDVGGGAGGG
jgi:hypothetical protein